MEVENPEDNNTLIKNNLRALLLSNIAFSFEISGQLYIRQISDGYAVGEDIVPILSEAIGRESWEKVIEDVDEALAFFIEKRREYEVGDDYGVYRLWLDGKL